MRYPVAKGFYSFDREILIREIESCFFDDFGPGYLPSAIKKNKKIIAGIVPHAGYVYSGPCAAFTYKELYENWDFDTIVIVGTNHYNIGANIALLITEDWYTPFGIVKTDIEFGRKIIEDFDAIEDPLPHKYEHSIEVQLPFLKYLFGDNFKIVPILIRDLSIDIIRDFAKLLREISEELNRRIFLLASGDLTHYGEIYGFKIFKENEIENVRKMDMEIISKILELNSEEFLNLASKSTVCGIYPFITFIEYSKLFNAKVELLRYYNSGEKTGSKDAIVGYSSIISYI